MAALVPWQHWYRGNTGIMATLIKWQHWYHGSVHDNFSEVSGQFVRTNSRMSRHSHICSDMIILISDQILCPLLLAIMYAVVSKHTYKDSGIFILFFGGNLAFSYFYHHVHYVFICKTILLHSVQVERLVQLAFIAPESTST